MKNFIVNLAKTAGQEILKNFHHDRILKIKTKTQIVTEADLLAEKIILLAIRKKFPSHQILSEEAGFNQLESDYLWIIDPLDGSTNYFIGNPLFAVSIALAHKNQIILGMVFAPALKELLVAEIGRGAFLNGKKIKVSKNSKIKKSILTYCHGSAQKDIKRAMKIYNYFKLKGLEVRQLGSASLELGFVAAGRTECIMIPGVHLWDAAAGALLVREAGGKVTDFSGREWDLNSKDILASNGRVHQEILKKIKRI